MTTERVKQVHLEELNQVSVIKHMVVTSAHQGLMNFKRCLKLLSGRVIITKYAQNCLHTHQLNQDQLQRVSLRRSYP